MSKNKLRLCIFVFLFLSSVSIKAFACKDIRGSGGDVCDRDADRMLNTFSLVEERVWLVAWRPLTKERTEAVMLYTDCSEDDGGRLPCKSVRMSVVLDKACRMMFVRERFTSFEESAEFITKRYAASGGKFLECACNDPRGIRADGTRCGKR